MSNFLPGQSLTLSFDGRRVRFVGTPDNPAWVARDVCDLLGIESVSQALIGFDDEERGTYTTYTTLGKRELPTVYEPGLYRLIMRSKKPEAKRFRNWVFKEVLPSIRRYGCYPAPDTASFELTLKPYTSRIVWAVQVRKEIPKGFWCVFIEGADFLIGAEQILGPADLELKRYDLLDGSIGRHWSSYRQDKSWMGVRVPYSYTFPDGDPRGTVNPWAYPMQELEHFRVWLHEDYWALHFPDYIKRKYGADQFQRALPVFASLGVPLRIGHKK